MTALNLETSGSVIALDYGEKRVGVALASLQARFANPLTTLANTPELIPQIARLAAENDVKVIVVGLPRNLQGNSTDQTRTAESFAEELKKSVEVPIYMQDEAATSRQAEAELQARGKPYAKEDIDALSATYILEDFISEQVNL
jgi:putative Holliday junction resolvase